MSDASDPKGGRPAAGGASPGGEGTGTGLRRAAARLLEAAGAIGVVLVFFLVCLGILLVAFPKGIGLGRLVRYEEIVARARPEVSAGEETWQSIVGMLSSVRRTVKSKAGGSIAWDVAKAGLRLGDRSAVQTYDLSGATIAFEGPSELRVGENSMVVVRKMERNLETGARRASVLLADGEIEGTISPGRNHLEVTAGRGTARLMPDGGVPADFRVATSPDESSTFMVYGGRAEVTAGGRSVALAADQGIVVDGSGALGAPFALPAAPRAGFPAEGRVITVRTLPAEVPFSWSESAGVTAYRLAVARDAGFDDVALDKRLDGTEFVHGSLPAGRYWWRISALQGSAEGRPSPAARFEVARDVVPPELSVEFPAGPVGGGNVLVRGTTEPGATVFVGAESAGVGKSGQFEGRVPLRPGPNVVVVEAFDAAGNVSYRSAVVLAVE